MIPSTKSILIASVSTKIFYADKSLFPYVLRVLFIPSRSPLILPYFRCSHKVVRSASEFRCVYPCVRMYQLGSYWTDFSRNLILMTFIKISRENPSLFKIEKKFAQFTL
jgi:hypothetical protein